MIKIAILEDTKADSDLILEYLDEYGKTHGVDISSEVFRDAVMFLENYKPVYDMVFLDIMMPHIDGMRAAEKLREIDNKIIIIFITNMGDYAVRGYDVGATAFMKKPVRYSDFETKMSRATAIIQSHDNNIITISSSGSKFRVYIRDIVYIDVIGHTCTFHLSGGKTIEGRNKLSVLADELACYGFMLCSSHCLINPNYIKVIDAQSVTVGNEVFYISRLKKKSFMLAFNNWLAHGGGING